MILYVVLAAIVDLLVFILLAVGYLFFYLPVVTIIEIIKWSRNRD